MFDVSSPDKPLVTVTKDSVVTFSLTIDPFSEKCLRIYYRQRHKKSEARYILSTTKNWEKPLEKAKYTLVVSKKLKLTFVSIPPEGEAEFDDVRIYKWKRKQFMPETDFLFLFDYER